jgi:hypothetical protein
MARDLETIDQGYADQSATADFWRNYEREQEELSQQNLIRIKQSGLNAAQTLLTAYNGRYKKFAQALLVFEKAKAIAEIVIDTQVAAAKAYKTYAATPPLAIAAAGAAIAFGAARIAAVASTVIGSNNAPSLGSAGNPVFTNNTSTSLQNEERPTAQAQRTTQVIFNGPIYNTDDFQRSVVDALRDVSDRDVIIFSGESAQAQVIRG